jgi:hypothetical protein
VNVPVINITISAVGGDKLLKAMEGSENENIIAPKIKETNNRASPNRLVITVIIAAFNDFELE